MFIFSAGGDLIPLSEGCPPPPPPSDLHQEERTSAFKDNGEGKRLPGSKEGRRCERNEDKNMDGEGTGSWELPQTRTSV